LGDLDDEDARFGQEAVCHAGALGQRAQPGDGLVAFVGAEGSQGEGHEEAHEVHPLADPSKVAHQCVTLDPAQQVRVVPPRFRLAPHGTGGEAFELRTDPQEDPETAVLPAALVEERLDRVRVIVGSQRPDHREGVDTLLNVRDPLQHVRLSCRRSSPVSA
jgi:hypothetical protein